MAIDSRVKYTKMVIRNSFIKLLEEKPISKITLKEVCDLAEINRSTFYKYYRDTYDWMDQTVNECMVGAHELLDQVNSKDIKVILTEMLQAIVENISMFDALFTNYGNVNFADELFAICLEKAETKLSSDLLDNPEGQRKWKCYFLAYGCSGIIRCWIKDGMKQAPAEVATYISDNLKRFTS